MKPLDWASPGRRRPRGGAGGRQRGRAAVQAAARGPDETRRRRAHPESGGRAVV